jgi:hypothetical protein
MLYQSFLVFFRAAATNYVMHGTDTERGKAASGKTKQKGKAPACPPKLAAKACGEPCPPWRVGLDYGHGRPQNLRFARYSFFS